MNILITGGTGFVGQYLIQHMPQHRFIVVSRDVDKARRKLSQYCEYVSDIKHIKTLDLIDGIINLAGEPIANKHWSKKQKETIQHSRWDMTRELVELIQKSNKPPQVFVSASAIGYYGPQGNQPVSESHSFQEDFTHETCKTWEDIALQVKTKTRVCIPRIGLVLGKNGGMLKRMLPAFKFSVGGRLGHGNQGMSWIHLHDLFRLIQWFLDTPDAEGVYNAVAPNPASNREFTTSLAKVLKRPAFCHLPAWVLKALMGELSTLLLTGQYVIPEKAQQQGFEFEYKELEDALQNILSLQ